MKCDQCDPLTRSDMMKGHGTGRFTVRSRSNVYCNVFKCFIAILRMQYAGDSCDAASSYMNRCK